MELQSSRGLSVRGSCTASAPAPTPPSAAWPAGRTSEACEGAPRYGYGHHHPHAAHGTAQARWDSRSPTAQASQQFSMGSPLAWLDTMTPTATADPGSALALFGPPVLDPNFDQLLLVHPLYPELVRALCACRQALAGGGSEAMRLEDAGRRALSARQEALQAEAARGVRIEDLLAQEPELQSFMEQYIYALEQYRADLSTLVQDMEQAGKDFDQGIAQLLQAAVSGADIHDTTASEQGEGTSARHKRRPSNDSATAVADSVDTVDDPAKDALKRKYAEKLQELHQEFSRKRRKGKLPQQAIDILKTWWQDNISYPYPTEEVKKTLIDSTGLDATQLNNWFINQRKRHWPGRSAEDGAPGSSSSR